ncbi:MAG: AI-2E family transporter [Gammaproteobacteria bacterium]|nr:AI-2E family transporter [Gammaproteobacteria bacterium]
MNEKYPKIQVPVWGLFMLAVLALLYFAQALLIPVALALLFAMILSPIVHKLSGWRIPRPASSLITVLLFFLALFTLGNYLAEPLASWGERLNLESSSLEQKFKGIRDSLQEVRETTKNLEKMADVASDQRAMVVVEGPSLSSLLMDSTQSFLIGLLYFVILLYFFLAFGDILVNRCMALADKTRAGKTIHRIRNNIQCDVSRYLSIITLINIGLGLATTLVMYLLDMPNPALWGTLLAVLNYFPYVGPALAVTIIAFISAVSFDSLNQIWPAPAAAMVLTIIEGQLLQPVLVGTVFQLNPILVFLSIIGWGWLWGIAGVIIAIPMLITLKVALDQNPGTRHFGQLLER